MRTSRTRPTKLATAPMVLFFEIARTSAPRSKSSRWTETFIRCLSSTSDRRKECDLITRLYAGARLRHVLVDRRPYRAIRREGALPRTASRAQMLAQAADGLDACGHVELLARAPQLLAPRSKKEQVDFHL